MTLETSFKRTQDLIKQYCTVHGRLFDSVKLMVASKTQSAERIAELHTLGQNYFGENYAQELFEKAPQLSKSIQWSFIGKLQSNKIKGIVTHAHEIQTLCSLKHAQLIARHAQELGKTPYKVFIEVQIPGDDTKSGIPMSEVPNFAKSLQENGLVQLEVQGIMAIPPLTYAKNWNEEAETVYKNLRQLANRVGKKQLSLGMSQDLEQAIRCGSDIVRIGTAIMGERPKKLSDSI